MKNLLGPDLWWGFRRQREDLMGRILPDINSNDWLGFIQKPGLESKWFWYFMNELLYYGAIGGSVKCDEMYIDNL